MGSNQVQIRSFTPAGENTASEYACGMAAGHLVD